LTEAGRDLVPVGKVGRPHGIDGSFVVVGASADETRFAPGATLYLDGRPVEVRARKRVGGGRLAIRVDGEAPRGATLAVPRDALPPAGEDEFYVFDLVGLRVVEEGGREVGTVTDVLQYPANDALEVDGKLLLPLVEDCVREVDTAGGTVVIAPGFAP
jgi:16S rRNA processing protein RimM